MSVEILVIKPDGQTDPTGLLDAREAAAVATLDRALHADAGFQIAYPGAALSRVDSMRGVPETNPGRYYLRYRHPGGMAEFWGHLASKDQINLKKGTVGAALNANPPVPTAEHPLS